MPGFYLLGQKKKKKTDKYFLSERSMWVRELVDFIVGGRLCGSRE